SLSTPPPGGGFWGGGGGGGGGPPPHKGGPTRPDRPNCSSQWSETAHLLPLGFRRSGHGSVATRGMGKLAPVLGCTHLPGRVPDLLVEAV
ncbi:MAG: hypothetical protein F4Z82_11065, partial [Caldilineaceae bacterium SB0668_bin_21]|nr:hypothetical protein [Caldilineaceae bacterium SB0668_bin_21]